MSSSSTPHDAKANLFDFIKSDKARPVKQRRPGSSPFKIPSRVSHAVTIVAPPQPRASSNSPSLKRTPSATRTPLKSSPAPESRPPCSGPSLLQEPPQSQLATVVAHPMPKQLPPLQTTAKARPPIDTSDSNLDVYAKNYIPIHLRAIQDSHAEVRQCQFLAATNFAQYIASFAGYGVLSPLEYLQLPPLTNRVIRTRKSAQEIDPDEYATYLSERLHSELCAQVEELQKLALHDIKIFSEPTQCQFKLEIPGIRENNPRIDLGDIVLVRPWTFHPQSNMAHLADTARNWYAIGGPQSHILAPGFFGIEYRAVVWGIQRAKEVLILRIDELLLSPNVRASICFIVQSHKCTPLYRAISRVGRKFHEGESSTRIARWRKSMLFPSTDDCQTQKTLSQGKFNIPWLDMQLNFEQQKAVDSIVKNRYGSMPFIISGPPGTGKTKTLVEATLQLLHHKDQGCSPHLLVCAPSDPAADTIAARLKAFLSPSELFRLNGWTRSFAEVPDHLKMYCYMENDMFTLPDFKRMMKFKVVVTTCRDAEMIVEARLKNADLARLTSHLLSICPNNLAGPHMFHWTGLLLDEAAQATEPEALIPISVIEPCIIEGLSEEENEKISMPQVIMAGDEHQLGPRLSLRVSDGLAMDVSMFQRIFERAVYSDHPLSRQNGSKPLEASMLPINRPAFVNLVRNYRSHPAILTTPSVLFYNDTLIPEVTQISDAVKNWEGWNEKKIPVLFRQCTTPDDVESILAGNGSGAGALVNHGEGLIAVEMVKSLTQTTSRTFTAEHKGIQPSQIMIMSPFRAQVSLLRTMCRNAGFHAVNIGPLEAFQGLESKVAIICTTRTRIDKKDPARFVREDVAAGLGLVGDKRKFNVALTRAKEGLIVIGDPRCLTCTKDVNWAAFLAFCKRNQCLQFEEGFNANHLQVESKTPIGRLERALMYSAEIRKREMEREERKALGYVNHGGILKGSQPSVDEEMWMRGMQAMELETVGEGIEDTVDYGDNREDSFENDYGYEDDEGHIEKQNKG